MTDNCLKAGEQINVLFLTSTVLQFNVKNIGRIDLGIYLVEIPVETLYTMDRSRLKIIRHTE